MIHTQTEAYTHTITHIATRTSAKGTSTKKTKRTRIVPYERKHGERKWLVGSEGGQAGGIEKELGVSEVAGLREINCCFCIKGRQCRQCLCSLSQFSHSVSFTLSFTLSLSLSVSLSLCECVRVSFRACLCVRDLVFWCVLLYILCVCVCVCCVVFLPRTPGNLNADLFSLSWSSLLNKPTATYDIPLKISFDP